MRLGCEDAGAMRHADDYREETEPAMTESGAKSILKIMCPACGRKLDVTELESFSEHPCPHCQVPFKVPKWHEGILLEDILHEEPGKTVYRALDPTLDREACVKVLTADGCFQQSQLDDFLAAARRMAAVNHVGVAAVYSCGTVGNTAYAVTKYMSSVAWRDLGGSPEVIRNIARQALAALEAADAQGLAHGGIRPENLLINGDGQLLVTDFGVSAVLGRCMSDDPYASPEVIAGAPPSRAGDIYSLGVCLYRQATGHFPGGDDIAAWRSGAVPLFPAKEYNPALPVKVSDILAQMLAPSAADRPRQFSDILGAFQGDGGLRRNVTFKMPEGGLASMKGARPARTTSRLGMVLNILIVIGVIFLALLGGLYALSVKQGRGILNADGRVDWQAIGGMLWHREPSQAPDVPAPVEQALRVTLPPACLASRPRPPDLDFMAEPEANRQYLAQIPEDLREREKERLRILGGSMDYLLKMMRFVGYDRGDEAQIEMRDGSRLRGVIPYASEKGFILRRRGEASNGSELLPIHAFSQAQIWDIFAFYAEKRAEMASGKKLPVRDREEIFDEYLRLALLCDWYNDEAKAQEYVRAALDTMPSQRERLAFFFPDLKEPSE